MRTHVILRSVALAVTAAVALGAQAQDYRGPIRIFVGYPPGGTIDNAARVLAEKMREDLGQQVLVENRPGAGGQIAVTALKASPADGSTILLANDHQAAIIPLTMKTAGYDPFKDLAPIGMTAYFEASLGVHPSTGAKTFAEYVAWLKANPGKSNMGIPAPASIPEFMVGLIGKASGVKLNPVPYKGGAPMVLDLLGGQIPAGISTPGEMIQHHASGKLRIIAVAGTARSVFLPDVPTFKEAGVPGLDEGSFLAFFGPAGMPRPTIDRYNRSITKALGTVDVKDKFRPLTMIATPSTPEELAAHVKKFHATWGEVIRASGFQPQ